MLADRPNSLVAADSAAIATYLPAYEIVHAIPGRFRLRIPQLNWDEDYATRLEWLVGHLTGVAEARVNSADRKSTRLNSSHQITSYAVFCLKKKKK